MKRIEDYLNRCLTADEMHKECLNYCEKMPCSKCEYCGPACQYAFLLGEVRPGKTLRELFFEKFPEAPSKEGIPVACIHDLGWGRSLDCCDDCKKCWNRLCKDVIKGFEE